MILQDKVAFITGGARGMGRAIALRYADEGCNSVIVDVLDKEGEETVADIKTKGRDAIYIHCDVSNSAQVKGTGGPRGVIEGPFVVPVDLDQVMGFLGHRHCSIQTFFTRSPTWIEPA